LGALLAGLVACGAGAARRASHTTPAALAPATLALELAKERSARRLHNFHARLHPMARALVRGQDSEHAWLHDALVVLPTASCGAVTNWTPSAGLECSLVALDEGAVAVLIMREAGVCSDDVCVEHSWVFLNGFAWPLPLPAPRISEYRRLRAELSREDATALWLAGFRGAGDSRRSQSSGAATAFAEAPDRPPPLSSYKSCTLAPDERELVCRATTGDVIGIHPLLGARRLIARLGLESTAMQDVHEPVGWTRDGQLTLRVHAQRHVLCGEQACELVALVAWPSTSPARADWTRADTRAGSARARNY
jgi:hypothetical protein